MVISPSVITLVFQYFYYRLFTISCYTNFSESGRFSKDAVLQFEDKCSFIGIQCSPVIEASYFLTEKNLIMPAEEIRIILVDDHKLVRESLRTMLDFVDVFSVVEACDNGYDAIEQTNSLRPDILLLDINMQPLNGFDVAEKVLEHNPAQKIICLSVNNLPSYANRMLALGVKGYLTKSSSFEEIIYAIKEVNEGREYIALEVRNMIFKP